MADDKEPERPTINGISEVEFNTWKHLPVTKTYMRFLEDRALDAIESATLMWLGGRDEKAFTDEARGMANSLRLAGKPSFDEMVTFYQQRDETKKQEDKANDEE